MHHMVTEDFVRMLLDEASTEIQEFRKRRSSGCRARHERYLRWLEHMESFGEWVYAQYTNVVFDAFLSYEEPINDYFYVQGILAAAGILSGQAVQMDGLECVPGLKERKDALDRACSRFMEQLPPEEQAECARQFAERIGWINDSRKFFFLHGFELMFTLLKRTGHEMPGDYLEMLYTGIEHHHFSKKAGTTTD